MGTVGRICLYCSKPLTPEDRVSACDRCYAAHHEECWNRNGRCSTFRCPGIPRTMSGRDLPLVLQVAMERANEQPTTCTFCGSKVYAGTVHSRPLRTAGPARAAGAPGATTGLLFVGKGRPNPHTDWFGRQFLSKMLGNRSWLLPGAHLKARSCGKCRRLYVWGMAVDDAFVERSAADAETRHCPHCATALYQGSISMNPHIPGGARFECDQAPDFHADWFGHAILDRYVLNRWSPVGPPIPAHSCPDCHYTEIAGRPIYRFV